MNKASLTELLKRDGYLKTPRVVDAFRAIDRKDFVIPEYSGEAYVNSPLPIGFKQTISQPVVVAFMIELLNPQPGEKILDVGSGSGWTTALLAELVGEKGKVIAIERIPELCKMTKENVSKYNFIDGGIVKVFYGDGSKGAQQEFLPSGGFNKILAGAAGEKIPEAWKSQLKIGGRIVTPVENSIVILDKKSDGEFEKKEHLGFRFVPLIEN